MRKFKVGDEVEVKEGVLKSGINRKGKIAGVDDECYLVYLGEKFNGHNGDYCKELTQNNYHNWYFLAEHLKLINPATDYNIHIWEKFKQGKLVINVKTQQEWKDFMKFIEKTDKSILWSIHEKPTTFDAWFWYKDNSAITYKNKNNGKTFMSFAECEFCKKELHLNVCPFTKLINKQTRILDDVEKAYLENVLRPFKNKVEFVVKGHSEGGKEYILAAFKNDIFSLPFFKPNTMYKGMESGKTYTLDELNLFKEEK